MKGKLFLILFATPFFGVGVWMLFLVGSDVFDSWQMQRWDTASAQLTRAGYEAHSGDDSNTYEAFAQYNYQFRGQSYSNNRVSIAGGSDNIGNYQMALGQSLGSALSQGDPIEIYVNPDDPRDSTIDRDLRWGLIGFRAIFVFTFGGFGLGLIIFSLRAAKPKGSTEPKYTDRPWLLNDEWQTAIIKSGSKKTMYFTWGFAAFWNLVSAPLPFVIHQEIVDKENYLALIGILFPLVGIGLITWAVRRTLEWRRFGAAPVSLDPFPGAIDGNVGGTIDVNLPYDANANFRLTLTSIYSYVSGSGDNRSRKERAKWQDSQVAHTTSGKNGTRLTFRFDVPGELQESDAEQEGIDYHLWRLNVAADLPGVDFDRDYEIPVYATGSESRYLSRHNIEDARSENNRLNDQCVQSIIRRRHGMSGIELYYPVGRNRLSALIGTVFGGFFAATGWYLMVSEGATFFGFVFGGVGWLVVLASLYSVCNSLQVLNGAGVLKSVRRVLGLPVRRAQIRTDQFQRFARKTGSQTNSGGKHVIHYSIFAEDNRGQKIVVGEGFKGDAQASAAIRLIAREFGLPTRDESGTEPDIDEFDVLATDR